MIQLRLSSIPLVQRFVSITTACDSDVNVMSEHFSVDGKSILGIFGLDLTKPMTVEFVEKKQGEYSGFLNMLKASDIDYRMI